MEAGERDTWRQRDPLSSCEYAGGIPSQDASTHVRAGMALMTDQVVNGFSTWAALFHWPAICHVASSHAAICHVTSSHASPLACTGGT